MTTAAVLVSTRDHVCEITLNRPDNRNAMAPELLQAFQGVIDAVKGDRGIRCVVITGTGAIQAGQATINGVGIREIVGTGALVAGSATILGLEVAVPGWLCGTPSIYAALRGTPDIDPALTATFTTYPEGCG